MLIKTIVSLSRRQKSLIFLLVDLGLVPIAYFSALTLQGQRAGWSLAGASGFLVQVGLLMVVAAALTNWLGMTRLRLRDYEGDAVARSAVLAALLGGGSALTAWVLHAPVLPGFHVIFSLVYFACYFALRQLATKALIEVYRNSRSFTRVAIYGAGRTGMTLARELKRSDDLVVYAFLDDNATLSGMNVNGVPVYSGVRAAEVKETYKINRVILAMPSVSTDKQTFIAKRLEKLGLEVQTLPAFTQLHGDRELLGKLAPTGPAALLSRKPFEDALANGCRAYRGATVMISGAGGSIGLELCRQVIACRPAKLVLFELSELALYNAEAEMRVRAEEAGVEIVPVLGSVADAVQVRGVLRMHGVEIVLHAAAYKHVPLVEINPRVGLANNTIGTAVLAKAARDAGVKRFVLVSSDKAVRPGNLMGASKRFAELVVQDLAERSSTTIFSIVRFGNVLGSSGSVISLFQDQIARGGPVTLTDKQVTRYFMTIEEASRLVLLAGSFDAGGEVYVLDMGEPIRIEKLARRLIEASGYTVRDAASPQGDIEIVTTGLRPGEKLHEELMVRKGAQATAHPKIIRVREDHLCELETAGALRDLRDAIERGGDDAVIAVVARVVREYNPQSLPESAPQCRIVQARRVVDLAAE